MEARKSEAVQFSRAGVSDSMPHSGPCSLTIAHSTEAAVPATSFTIPTASDEPRENMEMTMSPGLIPSGRHPAGRLPSESAFSLAGLAPNPPGDTAHTAASGSADSRSLGTPSPTCTGFLESWQKE